MNKNETNNLEQQAKNFYEQNGNILIEESENLMAISNETEEMYLDFIKKNSLKLMNSQDYDRLIKICNELYEITKKKPNKSI